LKQFDINANGLKTAYWSDVEDEDELVLPTYGDKETIKAFVERINGNKQVTLKEINDMMKINNIQVTSARNKTEKLMKILYHKLDNDDDE
jgi:hypothetical protein